MGRNGTRWRAPVRPGRPGSLAVKAYRSRRRAQARVVRPQRSLETARGTSRPRCAAKPVVIWASAGSYSVLSCVLLTVPLPPRLCCAQAARCAMSTMAIACKKPFEYYSLRETLLRLQRHILVCSQRHPQRSVHEEPPPRLQPDALHVRISASPPPRTTACCASRRTCCAAQPRGSEWQTNHPESAFRGSAVRRGRACSRDPSSSERRWAWRASTCRRVGPIVASRRPADATSDDASVCRLRPRRRPSWAERHSAGTATMPLNPASRRSSVRWT